MLQGRREFIRLVALGAMPGFAAQGKALRGVFPIAQTPFTDSNQLDIEALVKQVRFVDRTRVHGFVWPQLASEWATLSKEERLAGAEAIAGTGKSLKPAIVVGVQSPDVATSIEYAKHAAKNGADAIISLPPAGVNDAGAIKAYYTEVAKSVELPLIVQAMGDLSVGLIVEMYKSIPTFRYVKDEAGRPLDRLLPLREKSNDGLKIFSGSHGRTLIEEMRRGSSGTMPAAGFADLYAQTWDLWQSGKRKEAMAMHARTLLLLTDMTNFGFEAMKYILCLRGVFTTYGVRRGGKLEANLNDNAKRSLRESVEFVKPWLRT